jgi:hypothetical protein
MMKIINNTTGVNFKSQLSCLVLQARFDSVGWLVDSFVTCSRLLNVVQQSTMCTYCGSRGEDLPL